MRPSQDLAWHKASKELCRVVGHTFDKYILEGKRVPMPAGAVNIMKEVGLTDANEEPLYTGSIVSCFDDVGQKDPERWLAVVKFGEYTQDGSGGEWSGRQCFGFYLEVVDREAKDEDGFELFRDYEYTRSILEIPSRNMLIKGNIYEHPELLEKGEA